MNKQLASVDAPSAAVEGKQSGSGRGHPNGARRSGRLIIVSNRVSDPRRTTSAGGLAVALYEALAEYGGVWFGWSGESGDADGESRQRQASGIDFHTIDLSDGEIENYYYGFSNQCLWPTLHYRPDLVTYRRRFLECYCAANRRMAAALARIIRPDDVIWVHDYHLLPFGSELRRLEVRQPVGFFLHVPFPPRDVMTALPGHNELLRDLFAYDLIGFQTERDLRAFADYACGELGAEQIGENRFSLGGAFVTVGVFPVGIDTDYFVQAGMEADRLGKTDAIRNAAGGRSLIVGVDRLDYTKGLPERFGAYRRFLAENPSLRDGAFLLQIAPLSRDALHPYVQIQSELDRLEGLIHGQYADIEQSPIRYLKRPLPRRRLPAIFRAARVGLVTPLRDGMNLVAKEFVASQNEDDPGVLILSRFAGAAETMKDAVIVNPFDEERVASSLRAALAMPLDERKERQSKLMAAVRASDIANWRRAFLTALSQAADECRHSVNVPASSGS